MSSVASLLRTERQRERAATFQAERNSPRWQRVAVWWIKLALGIFNLGLSRRRWSLVGSFLHTNCPDKRFQRWQRRWWHLEGLELREIKNQGREGSGDQRRRSARPAAPPAPAPEPEPESEGEDEYATGEAPQWQPWDRPAPQVNIQVSVNVNNNAEPAGSSTARGSRQGGRAASGRAAGGYGASGSSSSRGRGRR